jgi:CBS domain-containing protein
MRPGTPAGRQLRRCGLEAELLELRGRCFGLCLNLLKGDTSAEWSPESAVVVAGVLARHGDSCACCSPALNFFASPGNAERRCPSRGPRRRDLDARGDPRSTSASPVRQVGVAPGYRSKARTEVRRARAPMFGPTFRPAVRRTTFRRCASSSRQAAGTPASSSTSGVSSSAGSEGEPFGGRANVAAEEAVTPGPSTVRPSARLEAIVERMQRQNLSNLPVTTSDGRLIGLLTRRDAEDALDRLVKKS